MVTVGATMPVEMAFSSWRFHNPVDIHFGVGVREKLGDAIPISERAALVCTPRGRGRIENDKCFSSLTARPDLCWVSDVEENPDVDQVQAQVERLRSAGVTAVISVGGGSVMDSAKAIAAGLSAGSQGLRQLISNPTLLDSSIPIPMVAVPTTSGTGSEVTPFATLWDRAALKKLSLAGPSLFPSAAYVDPELTIDLPEAVTVSTGLDALNQAAESIWNKNANPISLQFAIRAFALGFEALPVLSEAPHDLAARSAMAECSLLAGLAISHTRTALCHSMSYPLTSHFGVPHGLACAFTMRSVYALNVAYDDGRFGQLATVLGVESPAALGEALDMLLGKLKIADRVRAYIPDIQGMMALVNEMFTPGRADNNLAPVSTDVIQRVLMDSHERDR